MTIDWLHFTPGAALLGGVLIGISASLLALGAGRIAGIAGIAGIVGAGLQGLLHGAPRAAQLPRFAFIAGLLLAPWLWRLVAPWPETVMDVGPAATVAAGLLVGFGVRMGSGCTSGHGVCGLSRLSPRSLVATLSFMSAGFATVFVLRHLL